MLYLNHAGTSYPKPPEVLTAMEEALRASPEDWGKLYEASLTTVRREFEPEGQLLVTSGCTAALALVMGDLPWQEGDWLVTSSLEHHALDRQAQALELRRGVVRAALPYSDEAAIDLQALRDLLQQRPVRAVALTAASNITGQRLPLVEVGALCREHGVVFVVDAAQTFGTSAFEEAVRCADVLVAAGHKFALGPQGVGVLYAKPHVQFSSPGAACEVGDQACSTFPGFCDVGSVNLAGLVGLAAGLEWTRANGRQEIAERTESMAATLRGALSERRGIRLLGSGADPGAGAVVSFVFDGAPLAQLQEGFSRAGIAIRVGTHCAPQALQVLGAPDGCARVSFGAFNHPDSPDRVLAALERLSVR